MKHKLLVAVEGGVDSLATAVYAAQACAGSEVSEGGGMVILHVLPPLPPSVEGADATSARKLARRLDGESRKAASIMLKKLRKRVIREGANPKLVITEMAEESGSVFEQIIRSAAANGCDTIVVGRRGKTLLREFLAGSVVEHLLWKPTGYTIWIVEHAPPTKERS